MELNTESLKKLICNKAKDIKTNRLNVYLMINDVKYGGVDILSKYMRDGRWNILSRCFSLIIEKHKLQYDINKDKIDFRFEEVNESIVHQ